MEIQAFLTCPHSFHPGWNFPGLLLGRAMSPGIILRENYPSSGVQVAQQGWTLARQGREAADGGEFSGMCSQAGLGPLSLTLSEILG